MRGPGREERSAVKLLKTARARLEELEARLEDAQAAKNSSETSLDWLRQAVRAEREARDGDPAVSREFARFLEGAEEKRKALESTRDTLASEIKTIEAMLGEARAEIDKLKTLIDVSRRARARREQEAADIRRRALPSIPSGRTGAA